LLTYALNGTRISTDIFRLRLKCVPAKIAGTDGDQYTCLKFMIQQGEGQEIALPALDHWTYVFNKAGFDKQGRVFGIDHSKFEKLIDSNGKALPPGKVYHVYNTFIDFHAMCDIFAEKTISGFGIQDLKKIGQKIVHAAAFTKPPVNLGSNVDEGSFFENGEITLAFKGLSVVNGRQCAILGYDSGESSFNMIVNVTAEMKVHSVGGSHYKGDIYKDLKTNWVQKVTLDEIVVSETTVPMLPNKVNSVIEREIIIRNVKVNELQ